MFFMLLLMLVNFVISWWNAKAVGAVWSESKATGGMFRAYTVAGYVMAVCGFTMVYGSLLFMALPIVAPMIPALRGVDVNELRELSSLLLYALLMMFIIPSGFLITYRSIVTAWRNRTVGGALIAGWNTFAQIRNTASAVRHMPSVISRLMRIFKGKGGRSRNDMDGRALLIVAAIVVVVAAICGGWLTANAIMRKADQENDAFAGMEEELRQRRALEGAPAGA